MFTITRSLFFVVLFSCISIVADAQLLPSTDSVFFTNVKVGFERVAFLQIEAQSDLTITDIRIQQRNAVPGEFVLVTPTAPFTIPLAKGARRQFILRCKPAIGGKRTAALIIFTTAGDTTIELIGDVTTTQPDVITEPDTIDFGTIAPSEVKEIPYIIRGAGIDSILIKDLFVTNDNGPSVYFEIYAVDPAVTFPHRMGPNDTLQMMARFTGYDPVGIKTGRGHVFGDVSGGISCEFRGAVGKPEMRFSPQLLDLGIVPIGTTIDTFIFLHSIGEGAVTVESITPPPSYLVSNIPSLPHDINQADSLKLDIRFTAVAPGIYEEPLEAMAKTTAIGGRFRSALLKAVVLPHQLLMQPPEVLQVPCGIEATYRFTTLRIADTSTSPITISKVVSDNADVVVTDSALFPMTLAAGDGVDIRLDHVHRNASGADSAIIEIYNGNYVLLRDTVRIQAVEQFIELDAAIANGRLEITTKHDIVPYKATSFVLEVGVDRSDVVSLVMTGLSVHPSLAAATITPTFDAANSVYRFEILSPVPITLLAGDLIASIPLQHFYAKDSAASLTASAVVPEFAAGCVTFTPSSSVTTTPEDCNTTILRNHLRGEKLISKVSISENPIVDGAAQLLFHLLLPSQTTVALYDRLGTMVSEDFHSGLVVGANQLSLAVRTLASGTYTAVLTVRNGDAQETVSVPFVVTH